MKYEFSSGYIETNLQEGVFQLEFFHEQSNSLPSQILEKIAAEIENAGKQKDVHVLVLRSGGEKAFCAGASFGELSSIKNEAEGLHFFKGFANIINALRLCPKFVIGRIHEKCVGGGVGLAAACDYAIAVQSASVKLSELAIGIGAFVIGPVVERRIGNAAFMQLCIDAGNWRSAAWAQQKGLFAEVHESAAAMDASISKLSRQLVTYSPDAVSAIKKIFWEGTENWESLLTERAAISGKLVLSDFTREAIERFKKARK
jgi:methylglutaconyl-CoA hydratase